MLIAYKLHAFRHQMLHRFMMRFFKIMMDMIEESKPFSDNVFHSSFLPIAKSHKLIIYQNCKKIYEEFEKLDKVVLQQLKKRMEEGLDMQQICSGKVKPVRVDELPDPLSTIIKEMFEKLYTSVLRGQDTAAFVKRYGSIRQHFEQFHIKNEEITLCPFCGLSPVRTDAMMEYDHYLPKSIYPFHAVNLENLVPTCKDCNQTEKGAKEVLSYTGKLFYPYAENFAGIDIEYSIKPKPEIKDAEWTVLLASKDGLNSEVESWKKIYGIDSRYQNYASIRGDKWFKMFYSFEQKNRAKGYDLKTTTDFFDSFLEVEQEHHENFLRRPAYKAIFRDTNLLQAIEESRKYSA